MKNQENGKNQSTESSQKLPNVDMNGIWKLASTLMKDNSMMNAMAGLNQGDNQEEGLNLIKVFKQYTENSTQQIEELKAKVGELTSVIEELKQKVDFHKQS
ncbi:hypothetical protein [Halobacillus sp. BBL2006]|uniref:hypothetical protein n=1 Tax=Halobacillus sp. BBL2006 TaxID=1543706 RepID=UPI000543F6A1|nr:hypothetical protein [Halobacillus sp. BBL2006]KHE68825.1 hypothetical protein LD39_13850 [Halobacillus sp. BBL2006]